MTVKKKWLAIGGALALAAAAAARVVRVERAAYTAPEDLPGDERDNDKNDGQVSGTVWERANRDLA